MKIAAVEVSMSIVIVIMTSKTLSVITETFHPLQWWRRTGYRTCKELKLSLRCLHHTYSNQQSVLHRGPPQILQSPTVTEAQYRKSKAISSSFVCPGAPHHISRLASTKVIIIVNCSSSFLTARLAGVESRSPLSAFIISCCFRLAVI